MGEELVDGFFLVFEIEFHIRGSESEYKGVEEVSHGRGRESVDEVTEAMVEEEVKDDETGGVGGGVG